MRKYRDRAKKKNGNNTEWQNILTYSKGRQENGKRNLDRWSKRKATSNTLLLSKSLSISTLNINILHSQNTKSGIVCNAQPNYMLPMRNPIKYKETERLK